MWLGMAVWLAGVIGAELGAPPLLWMVTSAIGGWVMGRGIYDKVRS